MVYVWDGFIRLFHIFLIYSMIGAYVTFENGNIEHHALWGITILTLLCFRILWGFCGSHYARFKSFFFKPSQMIDYAKSFFKKAPSDYIGHNPLGGLSVFAMIIVIVLQSLSGLAMTDDIFFEGPFYHYFDQGILSVIDIIHRQNFNIILVIIAFHISAVFYYLFYKKNNLIRPMISGYKEGNCNNGKASLYQGYSKASMGVCLLLSALLWWALYQNLSL